MRKPMAESSEDEAVLSSYFMCCCPLAHTEPAWIDLRESLECRWCTVCGGSGGLLLLLVGIHNAGCGDLSPSSSREKERIRRGGLATNEAGTSHINELWFHCGQMDANYWVYCDVPCAIGIEQSFRDFKQTIQRQRLRALHPDFAPHQRWWWPKKRR
jgi:hypothetical protein